MISFQKKNPYRPDLVSCLDTTKKEDFLQLKSNLQKSSNLDSFLLFVELVPLLNSVEDTNRKKKRYKELVRLLGKKQIFKSPKFQVTQVKSVANQIQDAAQLQNFIDQYCRHCYNPLSLNSTLERFFLTPKLFGNLNRNFFGWSPKNKRLLEKLETIRNRVLWKRKMIFSSK